MKYSVTLAHLLRCQEPYSAGTSFLGAFRKPPGDGCSSSVLKCTGAGLNECNVEEWNSQKNVLPRDEKHPPPSSYQWPFLLQNGSPAIRNFIHNLEIQRRQTANRVKWISEEWKGSSLSFPFLNPPRSIFVTPPASLTAIPSFHTVSTVYWQ